MEQLIKLLDENLNYESHELIANTFYIKVHSNKKNTKCTYCGKTSSSIHSMYQRSFQDLPIQGKKVVIILKNKKMFCRNSKCLHTTFAESFDFLRYKAKKSKRLEEEILKIALNCSSLTTSKILSKTVVSIGKSTVCRLFKKKNQ